MTPTAKELIASKDFWKARMDQQALYIQNYPYGSATRPDKEMVLQSAWYLLEHAQFNYMSCHVMQELSEVFEPHEINAMFSDHIDAFNASSVYFKVIKIQKQP